jgi:hypothetical protein
MSFWTDIRDTVESVASVAGNFFLPGSGLVTSNLVSKGAQEQLGSGLGQIAMIGSGLYGGLPTDMGGAGNMANYGKVFDAAGNYASGGQNALANMFSSNTAGAASNSPAFTDLFNTYVSNGATPAEALKFTQDALSQGSGGATNWSKYLTSPSVLGSVISGGAGLLGAGLQANAARQAAQGIADANITSNQLMARMNEQNQARQEPFYQAGLSALPAYTQGVMPGGNLVRPFSVNDFLANKDPGQKYRTDMGLEAIESSAVAKGLGRSGKTYLDLMRAGQDYASQEYNNAYNRYVGNQATQRNALASLTGFAPTASSAMQAGDTAYGSNAANLASNTANAMAGAGATRASSYGNALAGIGQNIYNTMNPNPMNAMMAAYMQSQMAPKTGVTG